MVSMLMSSSMRAAIEAQARSIVLLVRDVRRSLSGEALHLYAGVGPNRT